MKRSARREKDNPSDSIHHRLNAYALAASAAGVGVLFSGQPTEAKVVYTPADHWLPLNRTLHLDVNHDGVNDFGLRLISTRSSFSGFFARSLVIAGSGNTVFVNLNSGYQCAAALTKGTRIGPKSPFELRYAWMFFNFYSSGGRGSGCPWLHVTEQAYLGLKFTIKGQVHYGWARLGYISANDPAKAKLTGYAYETIPNKSIKAGQTHSENEATLGRLAQGASGVAVSRQKQ